MPVTGWASCCLRVDASASVDAPRAPALDETHSSTRPLGSLLLSIEASVSADLVLSLSEPNPSTSVGNRLGNNGRAEAA
jgi:hypothetical protein